MKILKSIRAGIDITGVVIDVVLVAALIPIIVSFVKAASVKYTCAFALPENLTVDYSLINQTCVNAANSSMTRAATFVGTSGPETVILGLTTLFIVLALVFMIVKQSGLVKKR